MIRRLVLAAALLLLWTAPSLAADAKTDTFVKLPPVVLEIYDTDGIFHLVNMDLVLVMPEGATAPSKTVAEDIKRALQAIPYENYRKINPAPMIKAKALELVRSKPNGEPVKDVLIINLLFR